MKNSIWPLIHKQVFFPPAILLAIAISVGGFYPEEFGSAMALALSFITRELGWLFTLGSIVFVTFCLWAGFSKYGRIRLGGPKAVPSMSKFQWFAVSFTASLATGVSYWGVAEPMTYFMNPPSHLGLEGGTLAAANIAVLFSYLHWTFVPFSIYAAAGISIAFLFYNGNKPFRVSTALYPLLGEKAYGPIGNTIEAIAIFSTVGGIGTSLGLGTMQIASGLEYVFGIETGLTLMVIIIMVMAVIYTFVATTGIHRGIKHVGSFNMYLYFFLMLFVFFAGPTRMIIENTLTTSGIFLINFVPMVSALDPFAQTGWTESWTTFYWAWWLAFAPLAGLFMIKLARGRTIRDFVVVNLIAPTSFIFMWFGTFGTAGIASDLFEGTQIGANILKYGSEIAVYELLSHYPMATFTAGIAILLAALSFNTTAEAIAYTLSAMTTVGFDEKGEEKEPPKSVTVFWGFGMAFLTIILLSTGGKESMQALQTSVVVCGLPIIIIELFMVVAYFKCMQSCREYDKVGTFDDPLYQDIVIDQIIGEPKTTSAPFI